MSFCISLKFSADLKHRLAAHPDFAGYLSTRIAFDHSPQQQHRLDRTKISPFKNSPAIKIVNPLAQGTAVDGQLATLGLAKLAGLLQTLTTMGTLQPLRMKLFEQPLTAEFIIQ